MTSEHAFRTRLTIPQQRELFDYWRARAGRRTMPARRDLDPAAIPRLLPSIGLIDCGASFGEAVVRLAGSRLRDIYGLDITGMRLSGLAWGDRTGYWAGVYRRLVAEAIPLSGVVQGPIAGRDHVTLHWLRLPLSADDAHVNMILCYDTMAPLASLEAAARPRRAAA